MNTRSILKDEFKNEPQPPAVCSGCKWYFPVAAITMKYNPKMVRFKCMSGHTTKLDCNEAVNAECECVYRQEREVNDE